MKTSHTALLAIGALTFLLVGCKSATNVAVENAIEKQTGGQASVDMSNNAMHVTTSEGTFDSGGHTLPASWPTDVPAYAGATIQYTASANTSDSGPGSMVVLLTKDSVQTVADFYTSTLKTNGWTIGSTMQAQGTTIMTATKDTRAVSLSVANGGTQTTITIGVGKK